MSDTFVWSHHLRDLAHAVEAVETLWTTLGEEVGHSDLEYKIPPIDALIDGTPTGWTIGWDEDVEAFGVWFTDPNEEDK